MLEFLNSANFKLLSVLISIIVIVWLFLCYDKKNNNNGKIHLYYIAGICSFLIIEIVTYICMINDHKTDIIESVSFASSIISIILAVVTIIYSFYTNSRSDNQVTTLNNAAKDVKDATELYFNSADSLQENINKILDAINRVEQNTNTIRSSMRGRNNDANFTNFDINLYIKGFVNTASQIGNVVMYIAIKCKDNNKEYPLKNILDEQSIIYSYGFIIATASAGLMSASIDLGTGCIKCNTYLELLESCLDEWFEKNKESYIAEMKKEVDKYFEANPSKSK